MTTIRQPHRRPKKPGAFPEVYELPLKTLNAIADRYRPRFLKREDRFGAREPIMLVGRHDEPFAALSYVDARRDRRGASRGYTGHPATTLNFPILYRLAELRAERLRAAARSRRESPPPRELLRTQALYEWGAWRGDPDAQIPPGFPCSPPSRATIKRYRDGLGCPLDAIDRLILEEAASVLKPPHR